MLIQQPNIRRDDMKQTEIIQHPYASLIQHSLLAIISFPFAYYNKLSLEQYRMKKEIVNLFHTTFTSLDKTSLSIGELEKNILRTSKGRRRDEGMQDRLPVMAKNHSDFKIISPFYDRNKVCKALNCHCPYHKRIKEEAIKKYQIRSRPNFNSTIQSPAKDKSNQDHEIHPRLSHNPLLKNKQNTSRGEHPKMTKFSNGNKINSFNFQFEQFLKWADQTLLNKKIWAKINDHTIKSSVGQIFEYIYTHLDSQRNEVKGYIENLEKDRDLTDFYLERYDDLKKRRLNQGSKPRVNFSKDSRKQSSKHTTKSNTRIFQRQSTNVSRKTNKERTQKSFIMDRLIKIVKQGAELDDEDISTVAQLDLSNFQQNCNILKKKIGSFDLDLLEDIKDQIILKLKKKIRLEPSLQNGDKKAQIIEGLLKDIDQKVAELEEQQNQSQCERQQYDRIGSSYSKISMSRNGSCEHQGKKRNSKFNDLARKTLFLQENKGSNSQIDSEICDQVRDSQVNAEKQVENSPRATLNSRFNTTFQNGQDEQLPESIKKNQSKLKLAKYRRLSHDGFIFKNIFNDQQDNFVPKIRVDNIEDISIGLEAMAMEFGQKWKKIKQIEKRISHLKMKKFIICEDDSLFTAKRKIRMLRNFIKQEMFEDNLKQDIKEYVTLIQQFNMLKNRNWAERKLRNMMSLKNDDIEMVGGKDEPLQEFIHKNINDIFGKRSKLMYYDVSVAQYQEKQICLENQLFQFIEKDLKLQNTKSMKLQKKMTKKQSSKVKQEQIPIRQDELVQVGLENHYSSQFCYNQCINFASTKFEQQNKEPLRSDKLNDLMSPFKYIQRMRLAFK